MALLRVECNSRVLGGAVSFDVILPQKSGGVGVAVAGARTESVPGRPEGSGGSRSPAVSREPERASCPVLWLLHGATDDHSIWQRRTSIERYVASLGLAVVMPAASLSSYTDMAYGRDYFTFVAEELPELCRSFFPKLSADPGDNYIAGLSMGGYGAFKIALTHPERYAAACCLSAGNSIFNRRIPAFFDIRRRNKTVFGVEDGQLLAGTKHDLYHLAEMASKGGTTLPRLFHACGTEDFSYENALELKEHLESIPGDPFRYEFHAASGSHTWEFWDEWIQVFLATLPAVGAARDAAVGAATSTATSTTARQG